MIYTGKEDIKRAIKSAAAFEGVTLAQIAEKIGVVPQQVNNILNKAHVTFDDLSRLAAAIGYKLDFKLVPGPALFQDGPNDQPGPQQNKPGTQSSK